MKYRIVLPAAAAIGALALAPAMASAAHRPGASRPHMSDVVPNSFRHELYLVGNLDSGEKTVFGVYLDGKFDCPVASIYN